ncbi:MAG: MFS transporter [Promethearchaeota archaeon]
MILSKRSVILILISVILFNTIGMAVYTYIPLYLLNLGAEKTILQLIVTILPLTSFVFPPFLGKYSDKIQKRFPFIIIGAIGITVAFTILLFWHDMTALIVFLLIYGFFSACAGTIFVLFQELVENDPRYISYYNAAIVLGWFLGAQLGGFYIDILGIAYIFQILLIFSLINTFFVLFITESRSLILERYESLQNENSNEILLNNLESKSKISSSIYYALLFRNFGIRPIIAILVIIMAFHLNNDTEIGFLIGINPLIQFFLMIVIGRIITDKNIKKFMILGYVLSAVVILGYIISIDFLGYLFYQILISFSYSMFYTATQVYIAQNTTPKNKGKYTGYANSSFYLGSFLGGLFFSSLLAFNSDYFIVMYSMIIFPLISALIVLIKFEKKSDNKKIEQ